MQKKSDNKSDGPKIINFIATVMFALVALITLAGNLLPPLQGLSGQLKAFYFFLMEFLFYYAGSNEAIIFISIIVLTLALAAKPIGTKLLNAQNHALGALGHLLWFFSSVLAILAQTYIIAFALLTNPLYFVIATIVFLASGFIIHGKKSLGPFTAKKEEPPFYKVPATFLILYVAIHLYLAAVAGHLATPIVHYAAKYMSGLSQSFYIVYNLAIYISLAIPVFVWVPFLKRENKIKGIVFIFLPIPLVFIPSAIAPYIMGIAVAVLCACFLATSGFRPVGWLHFHPADIFKRLVALSLLALNVMVVHYAVNIYRCPNSMDNGVRKISGTAGVFDMVLTPSDKILASIREERRFVSVNVSNGVEVEHFRTEDIIPGTGSYLSWSEPETLLSIQGGTKYLLLIAVSDDENLNKVAILDGNYKAAAFINELPQAGVSDFVSDGQGSLYFSTEFEDKIYVVDENSLAVTGQIQWPGAETNRILVDASSGVIYSLGLWSDPMLRLYDMKAQKEDDAVFVGTKSWDMAYSPKGGGTLYIPKMLSGNVLMVDASALQIKGAWSMGFGARPVEYDSQNGIIWVGNMYRGTVAAFSEAENRKFFETYIGGYIKSLKIDPETSKAYVGCTCGIFEIDPADIDH